MKQAPQKTVYFVRHGQSEDNAAPVFQSLDSPLSAKGRQQARDIADRLSAIEFDTLIASPVLRAKQTAEHIAAATGKSIVFSDLFVERIKPAEIGVKPWTDEAASRLWHAWEASINSNGARVGNAETYADIVARADASLAYLLARPEDKLVVVTHSYFLQALLARVLLGDDISPQAMQRFIRKTAIENTALTVLHYQDAFEEPPAWRLWSLNDHSHFTE